MLGNHRFHVIIYPNIPSLILHWNEVFFEMEQKKFFRWNTSTEFVLATGDQNDIRIYDQYFV
jgi:hypothetical protein